MFERFTEDARAVVEGAVGHAERERAERVEEVHLLLALLDREGSRGSFALAALGLSGERRERAAGELVAVRRRGGLSRAEEEALAGLGIDLAAIVSRVEETHGEGALASAGGRRSRRRPFGRGAKEVLTQSLRIALARRDREIGDQHLLLALAARPGVPAEVLADHGVTHDGLVRVLYGGAGEAKAG
ncbi:Clp protease N-terminal domain-containing protein [Streptomyces sp. NPDC093094]|uniref:Clp protease N-terminal domain-containing protein n=1 Tax=Streptomyces sp. NPDC093094 TaxID=3366026 RepID=UPI0038184822